jgi:hypothetical protein
MQRQLSRPWVAETTGAQRDIARASLLLNPAVVNGDAIGVEKVHRHRPAAVFHVYRTVNLDQWFAVLMLQFFKIGYQPLSKAAYAFVNKLQPD